MINADSHFRRLSPHIHPKQRLFFDGIRHAAEFCEFAYSRLTNTLTEIALTYEGGIIPNSFTSAFVDAWAVVDSIDRLRGLLRLLPGLKKKRPEDGKHGFLDKTAVIRSLRNVSDHLAQRADYVLAMDSAALGILSWFTFKDEVSGVSCMIMPGTVSSRSTNLINPIGSGFSGRTGLVTLTAGEYTACLSDAVAATRMLIQELESGLKEWHATLNPTDETLGSDLLVAIQLSFAPVDERNQSKESSNTCY